MWKTNNQQKSGFTIAEVIIAIGIFSLLTVIVSSMIVSVLEANIKTRTYSLSLDNANIVMENMIRDIREGSNYHCGNDSAVTYDSPRDCEIAGDEYFAYEQAGGDPTTDTDQIVIRKALVAGLRSVIQKSTDGGQSFSPAFSMENVAFDNLRFFVHGSESSDEVSRVTIVMSGEVAPQTNNTFPFSFQTTVSERFSPTISRESEQAPVPPPYPEGGSDTTVPDAWFVSPTDNSVVEGGDEVSLVGDASDAGTGVKEVEFFDENGVSIGSDNEPPYTTKWNSLSFPDGTTYLSVVARDFSGNSSDPANGEIRITLQNPTDTDEPTVSIIRPSDGESFNDTDVWDMEVFASDDTSISRNEFYLDGTSLGIQSTSGGGIYKYNVTSGSIDNRFASCNSSTKACEHEFRTEVQDSVGKNTSAQSTFYIVDTRSPSFSSFDVDPSANIEEGDEVDISITVTDSLGGSGVDDVELFIQRTSNCWFGSCTNSYDPDKSGANYSYEWEAPNRWWSGGDNTYRIWFEAEDRVGNQSTSLDIMIEVEDD